MFYFFLDCTLLCDSSIVLTLTLSLLMLIWFPLLIGQDTGLFLVLQLLTWSEARQWCHAAGMQTQLQHTHRHMYIPLANRYGMLLMLRGSFRWQARALRSTAANKRVALPHCLRPINQTNATSGKQNVSVMHVGIPVMLACLYGPLWGKGFKGVHKGAFFFFFTPVWLRANAVWTLLYLSSILVFKDQFYS